MNTYTPKPSTSIRITNEGWIYLVILAFISTGAVLRNVNLLILMAGMMVAPMLINWRLGIFRAKTLAAKRAIPFRVHARQLSNLQWICLNRSALSAWGIDVFDSLTIDHSGSHETHLPRDVELDSGSSTLNEKSFSHRLMRALIAAVGFGLRPSPIYNVRLQLTTLAGHQQEVANGRLYFAKRGLYRFGPARLVTRFPFGLIETRIEVDSAERLYVAPAIGTLTPVWERRVRSVLTGSDALLKRRGLAGDDFYALRRWRSGDSQKLIHWRTSAKHGYPIVKQFEQPDNRDFAMLLDLYVPPGAADERNATVLSCETVLSFATTVILNIGTVVQGRIALAICGSRTSILHSRSLSDLIENAMRNLATARPSSAPELVSSILTLSDSVSPSTPIVVISSRPRCDFSPEDPLDDSVDIRRLENLWHSIVWISVDSPEFNEIFRSAPDSEDLRSLATKWREHVPD